MRAEPQKNVDSIQRSFILTQEASLDWDTATRRLDELNRQAEDPELWNNQAKAKRVMRERQRLEHSISSYQKLEQDLDDCVTLIELGEIENDESSILEAEEALSKLNEEAQRRSVEALLSGEADGNDAYLEIHAGAGGTESQDWAEMLLRMYMRWAERSSLQVKLIEESPGEEAGIKSATLEIKGENAYGWIKTESGVHRLCVFHPSTPMPDVTQVLHLFGSIPLSMTILKLKSTRAIAALIPIVHQAQAVSTSTHRLSSPHHAPPQQILSLPANKNVAKLKIAQSPGQC